VIVGPRDLLDVCKPPLTPHNEISRVIDIAEIPAPSTKVDFLSSKHCCSPDRGDSWRWKFTEGVAIRNFHDERLYVGSKALDQWISLEWIQCQES
jgi:hypothetical protein